MELAALGLAALWFGWVALVIGVSALLATVVTLVALVLSQGPRQRLEQRRAARWEHETPPPGGLMSGFFEVPTAPR